MPDEQSQYESFSLANMVPQNPNYNRGAWAKIESEVRSLAMERGKLYVISGPIFSGDNQELLKGAVGLPDKLFKAVFDIQNNES
jgi:endonuclease G